MTGPVFVDTSGWVAAVDKKDRHHAKVKDWMESNRGRRLITTSFVLDETLTLLRRRIGYREARKFGESIFKSRVAQLVYISQVGVGEAWKIFVEYYDQEFSFTDCTSFAVMKRMRLVDALAIDKHFAIMNFSTVV